MPSCTCVPHAACQVIRIESCTSADLLPGLVLIPPASPPHLAPCPPPPPQVSLPTFGLGLPAYYVLALSEASSNLSRYDGVRYGARAAGAGDLAGMYCGSRGAGLGDEVKRRILMGTYALSAGYYDAYYKRAQQVGGRMGAGVAGWAPCGAARGYSLTQGNRCGGVRRELGRPAA